VRDNVQEMLAAEAPAGTLAIAFAAGTLISTIPVPLVDMALAAYVTKRYADMPRAPFFTGMALANNLFMAPLYASTPKVGGLALHWLSRNTPIVAPEAFLIRILVWPWGATCWPRPDSAATRRRAGCSRWPCRCEPAFCVALTFAGSCDNILISNNKISI
jgi:hypothetical protein